MKTWRVHGFYVHDQAMDLFIELKKIIALDADDMTCIVTFWNRGYVGKPWIVDPYSVVQIARKDFDKWKQCTPQGFKIDEEEMHELGRK